METSTGGRGVEVAIAGGGIIGCAIAYELARRGVSVAVVERGQVGHEASGASAGIISPPSALDTPPEKARLTARSVLAYPAYIERLQEETGADSGWRMRGELTVALGEADRAELLRVADMQEGLGFQVEWLDGQAARELEPVLSEQVLGGALVREGGSLFSAQLTRAIAEAARRHGARIIEATPVLEVLTEGERGQVRGLRLSSGELPAGQVVLAAGAWTAGFGLQLGRPLPTVPVKGQMLAIAGAPLMPRRIIGRYGSGHLVPRPDGTVAVGATKEWVEFDKRLSPRNVAWSLELLRQVAPALLEGEIISLWAGLRPGSRDEQPLMGAVPGYQGLWVATGHFQTGIQLAVITAELMAGSIVAGASDPQLAPFSPARFQDAG
ncbi:MAG TPA: glycine oxidase ThiO [Thermomicrobiaceae bacterium]|nr:glycine oxidase ThiO [Thermomicrobiaceae bacterium]